jgi:hypothetical protein
MVVAQSWATPAFLELLFLLIGTETESNDATEKSNRGL